MSAGPGSGMRRSAAAQGGFAYLAVLLFIAVFGAISAGVVAAGSGMARRAAEDDLLFVGAQFRNAIRSYYESGAGGRRYALSFEELLRDKRAPGVLRHLRRVYPDPMTGKEDWGLVLGPEGGIIGVYSKATGTPLKTDGFAPEFPAFTGQQKYSDWVFSFVPQAAVRPGTRTGQNNGAQNAVTGGALAPSPLTTGQATPAPPK